MEDLGGENKDMNAEDLMEVHGLNEGRNYIFNPSWLSTVPDILLVALFIGMFTLPVKILRILTTRIRINNGMVYGEVGILSKDVQSIPIKHIQGVRVEKPFWGRIFGYGDVVITTAGDEYYYKCMADPDRIRDVIYRQITK